MWVKQKTPKPLERVKGQQKQHGAQMESNLAIVMLQANRQRTRASKVRRAVISAQKYGPSQITNHVWEGSKSQVSPPT